MKSFSKTLKKAEKHLNKIKDLSKEAVEYAGDIQEITQDVKELTSQLSQMDKSSKLILAAALLYILNPFDAIPDMTPAIGFLDDIAVLTATAKTILRNLAKAK